MQAVGPPESNDMHSDTSQEIDWEGQASDQRTHYENHDYLGTPDPAPLRRRLGAWVAGICIDFFILLILMSSYQIP